jgi:hypothetical protein
LRWRSSTAGPSHDRFHRDDHRGAHGVEPICKVLRIAPSSYHAHAAKRRDPARLSARARQDAAGDMAVAYFMVHAYKSFFPLLDGGDAAILYCFIFLRNLRHFLNRLLRLKGNR